MVRGDIARSQKRTIELLRNLLQEALDCVEADEQARRESWTTYEVATGDLVLDLGHRIREALAALGVDDDPIVDYHTTTPATPETVRGLWPQE